MAQSQINHAVIISHYLGIQDTNECLASVAKANRSGVTVYLIITGSKTGLKLDYPWLSIITTPKNLGYSGSNNLGITRALHDGSELITLLNNDTIISPNLFTAIQHFYRRYPKLGAVSGKIYFSPGREFRTTEYNKNQLGKIIWYAGGLIDWANILASHRGVDQVDIGQFETRYHTEFATGCLLTTTRYALDQVGLLDERYFLYLEAVDLSIRLKRAGYQVTYDPVQVIWHKNAGSTGGSGSDLHDYYLTRNRLLFGFQYAGVRAKFALARHSVKLLVSGRPWQKEAVKDYYTRQLGQKASLHSKV